MSYRILILPIFGFVAAVFVFGTCDYMYRLVCSKRNVDDDVQHTGPLPHHGFVDVEERGAIVFRRECAG